MSYFGYPLYPVTPTTQLSEVNISGTTTLGAGAATYTKAFIITGAGGYTITLPALDATNYPTASFSIFNNATALCTINVAASTSDTMLLLGSSYTSVSILPGEKFVLQNMQTSWTIALESASRTTTASQFDNTIRSASTAFVQRALGNSQTGTRITSAGNAALSASQAGGSFSLEVASTTYTLPLLSAVVPGATFEFLATVNSATVSTSGTDTMLTGSIVSASTCVLNNGDTAKFVSDGTYWVLVGGSAALRLSLGDFGKSAASSGYQKLPNGMIFQWGNGVCAASATSNVTFPIAFPNQCLNVVVCGYQASGNTQAYAVFNGAGPSGFSWNAFLATGGSTPVLCSTTAGVDVYYTAVGY